MATLANKVVLITGASSGFGEDAARLFAAEGCKVVLAARRMDRLQELSASIQDAGGEAMAIPVDILNHAEIDNMVRTTLDLYGQIDILFNNAGIGRVDWFERFSVERDIETLINVNLTGLIQVTRAVLPNMLARRRGHIINMISVAGLIAPPLITTYSASKYGARAFTDGLRREVSPLGVRVTGIYPGPATTEFGRHLGENRAYGSVKSFLKLNMSSKYVAQRVVDMAKRPRRSLVIPWWFNFITIVETLFPILVDWVSYLFSKRNHKLD
jgi:short-subunit dehydrogenase